MLQTLYQCIWLGMSIEFFTAAGTIATVLPSARSISTSWIEGYWDHPEPFFLHGPSGSFFADGVSIGNCYTAHGVRYMLFMGWQTPPSEHWRGDIGRLILHSILSLTMDGDTPFMSVSPSIRLAFPIPGFGR